MGFPAADPRKGGSGGVRFTFHTLCAKEKCRGHKAGEMVAAMTHHFKASKPCMDWLTNGEVPCVLHQSCRLDWLGYLPIYHESGRPVIVGMREYNIAAVAEIKVGSPLMIVKGDEKHSAIAVFPAPTLGKYQTGRPGPLQPVDITDKLIELWNVPELSAWWSRCGRDRIMAQKADSAKQQSLDQKPKRDQSERERLAAIKDKDASELTADEAISAHRTIDYLLPEIRDREHRNNGHLPKKG
jgi:hypothetical protein